MIFYDREYICKDGQARTMNQLLCEDLSVKESVIAELRECLRECLDRWGKFYDKERTQPAKAWVERSSKALAVADALELNLPRPSLLEQSPTTFRGDIMPDAVLTESEADI